MNEEILKKIEALETRITALEGRPSPGANTISGEKQLSAKEFLLSKKVSGDIEKTLALAYYTEKTAGIAPFNVEDLKKTFRSSKEQMPENLNDKINKNIAKGYLMDSASKKDSKKAWELTASGERCIETLK